MTSAGLMKLGYSPANGLLTADTVGGVITNYTYSTFGELASKEAKFGATSLFRVEYVRDSLGRITEQREMVDGRSEKKNYAYDVIGRLSKVWKNDTLTSEYSYDANGNRLAKTTPTVVDSGLYDAQDRLLQYGNTTYIYSSFGDLKLKAQGLDTTRYVYDAFGSLVSVTQPNGDKIEYLLDGNGLRVGRKFNGVITNKWLYSNNLRITAELDSANTITSRFVYTTSENVPEYMVRGGVTYRLVTDHLGSLRQVVNTSTGAVVEQIEYDEFGNVLSDSDPGFVPFGFAGGLFDGQTKLVRFGARDYDAASGRWLVKDPIRFEGGSKNLYSYAFSDPVNSSDASGKLTELGKAGFGASISAGLSILADKIANELPEGRLRGAIRLFSVSLDLFSAYESMTYAVAAFGAASTPIVGHPVGFIVGGALFTTLLGVDLYNAVEHYHKALKDLR